MQRLEKREFGAFGGKRQLGRLDNKPMPVNAAEEFAKKQLIKEKKQEVYSSYLGSRAVKFGPQQNIGPLAGKLKTQETLHINKSAYMSK